VLKATRRTLAACIRRVPYVRRLVLSSTDYALISREMALKLQASGWLSPLAAHRQQRAYGRLLNDLHAGTPRVDLIVAAEAVKETGLANPTLLDVGCGSGYYTEVFDTLLLKPISYCGLDFSKPMLRLARRRYPEISFVAGDATKLPFSDDSFELVFNGVSLMHILDYESAIAESRRVARRFCIFHSVPVLQNWKTTVLRKYAYGGLVVETVFERAHFLDVCARNRLKLVRTWHSIDYDIYPATPEHSTAETFLFATSPEVWQ